MMNGSLVLEGQPVLVDLHNRLMLERARLLDSVTDWRRRLPFIRVDADSTRDHREWIEEAESRVYAIEEYLAGRSNEI